MTELNDVSSGTRGDTRGVADIDGVKRNSDEVVDMVEKSSEKVGVASDTGDEVRTIVDSVSGKLSVIDVTSTETGCITLDTTDTTDTADTSDKDDVSNGVESSDEAV